MVDQMVLESNWNQIRGKLKEKWGKLTDDDISTFSGNVDQLIGQIQRKTGESRQAVEHYLEKIADEGSSMLGRAQESVGQAANRMGDTLNQGYASAERAVKSRPAQSLLAAFGCGVMVGLAVAAILHERERPPAWTRGKHAAEHFGRQIVDSITAALPESFSSRMRG